MKQKLKHITGSLLLLTFASSIVSITTFSAELPPALIYYQDKIVDRYANTVTSELVFRFSLWTDNNYELTDLTSTGAINSTNQDFMGYEEIQTLTADSASNYIAVIGSVTPLPAIGVETKTYLQVEIKPAGTPDTSFEVVDIDSDIANTNDRKMIDPSIFTFNTFKQYMDENYSIGTQSGQLALLVEGGKFDADRIINHTKELSFTINEGDNVGDVALYFGKTSNQFLKWVGGLLYRFELSGSLFVNGALTVESGAIIGGKDVNTYFDKIDNLSASTVPFSSTGFSATNILDAILEIASNSADDQIAVEVPFTATGGMISSNAQDAILEAYQKNATNTTFVSTGTITATTIQEAIEQVAASASDDQVSTEVPFSATGIITATNIQEAIEQVVALTSDDQVSTEVSFSATGTISATNVQAAIEELAYDISNIPASDVEFIGTGSMTSTNVQNAIYEIYNRTAGDIIINSTGGLTSTTIQGALEELSQEIASTSDDQTAFEVPFSSTGFTSTSVQGAIEELGYRITSTTDDQTATEVSFTATGGMISTNVEDAILEAYNKDSSSIAFIATGSITSTTIQGAIEEIAANATDDQTATEVSFTATGGMISTNVEDAILEAYNKDSSSIAFIATGSITSTTIQGAIEEIAANATDDQTATEVPYSSTGGLTATNVSSALDELTEKVNIASSYGTGGTDLIAWEDLPGIDGAFHITGNDKNIGHVMTLTGKIIAISVSTNPTDPKAKGDFVITKNDNGVYGSSSYKMTGISLPNTGTGDAVNSAYSNNPSAGVATLNFNPGDVIRAYHVGNSLVRARLSIRVFYQQ